MQKTLRPKLASRALTMLIIITFMSFGIGSAFADDPSPESLPPLAGQGSLEVPYEISDCEGLQRINENEFADYILTQDIDCGHAVGFNNGSGFTPLEHFRSLDGRNFSIYYLTVSGSSDDNFGFIKEIAADSTVKNIGLVDSTVINSNANNPAQKMTGLLAARTLEQLIT